MLRDTKGYPFVSDVIRSLASAAPHSTITFRRSGSGNSEAYDRLHFNNYACLVGPNGAGKSTVLTALKVFFREFENTPTDLHELEQEDFHLENTTDPIRITVAFSDLGEKAREDFSDYVRQERLVVTAEATFNSGSGRQGEKISELKNIYNGFRY